MSSNKPHTADSIASLIVVVDTGCHIWCGYRDGNGYGSVRWRGAQWKAHRVTYTLAYGEIPAGLTLDHLCRERSCVNPRHLEAVTSRINTLRGTAPATRNVGKTHCVHGHEFTPANTRIVTRPDREAPGRECRTCAADALRRFREANPNYNKDYFAKNNARIRETARARYAKR